MNKKGFTLVEVLVTFVIIAIISGIGVIAYKSFFDVGENNYYKSLESNILLSANDYFQDNRDQLPVADNYKEISLSELVEKKYIEDVKSSNGETCTGTVVAYKDNKKYSYEVCLVCGNYQSKGKYCHSEEETPQPQRIIINARTSKGSYNPNLSYGEAQYASENVIVTFNMNNIEVSKYDIINTNTREKYECVTHGSNTCEKEFSKSGTYSVTSYDKNGKVIIANQRMNIKIIEKDLGFKVIGIKAKYKIENATCGSNKTARVDFTIQKDQDKLNEEYKRVRYILKRNDANFKEKEMSSLSETINVGSGHYELTVEITNFANDVMNETIPFDVVYDVNLAYSDGTSGKHEVVQGYSYDYVSELPKVKDAYGAKDLEIRWSKNGTSINGTSIVNEDCTHTLNGQLSIPVTPPTNFVSYCVDNLIYNGKGQTLTKTAPENITFLNNVGTNAGTYTVKAHINAPIYIWSDGSFDDKTFECSIGKATPVITLSATSGTVAYNSIITYTVKSNVAGKFTNTSGNVNVATVSPENQNASSNVEYTITITGKASSGSATITNFFAPTDTTNYSSISKTYSTSTQQLTCNAPTNVSISTDGKVTWTASSNCSSAQHQISINNSSWTNATSGVDYKSTIIASTGTRTVYVRAVAPNSNYSTSSSGSKSTIVYSVTVTKGTGISSVSGGGNYIKGSTATINATMSDHYIWSKWTGTPATSTQKYSAEVNGDWSATASATSLCSAPVDKPSCGNYGSCSVTYQQQTGTKTRSCTHKYYSNVSGYTDHLCSTGETYNDSTSCTGTENACASGNTKDTPSCGNYGSCSVTYQQQTGTKTRSCTHKYYSTKINNYLCSTGTTYNDSASCNGATNACASGSTKDVPSCGNYGSCSVTYKQQTGTKTRSCTHKYYSTKINNYLCSTGTTYNDSASCTGTADACASGSTKDTPSCGSWSSCSVGCKQLTGSHTRSCTHKYYSTKINNYLCSTGTSYSESGSCNGASNCAWVLSAGWDSTLQCGIDAYCKERCPNNGHLDWSCTNSSSSPPSSPHLKTGKYCWCLDTQCLSWYNTCFSG